MLSQNDLLLDIAKRLEQARPEDSEVLGTFMYRFRKPNEQEFVSQWAEAYLRASLEQICADYKDRVIFDPITRGSMAGEFIFERRKSQRLVTVKSDFHTGHTEDYSDIDELLVVDGLPVLFEIKVSQKAYHGAGRQKTKSGRGADYAMRYSRISHAIKPIQSFFRRPDCAYVMVLSKNIFQPDSQHQAGFARVGGILVPFYATKDEFAREVARIRENYKL